MDDFINSFALWITIISGILCIWAFFKASDHKRLRQPATTFLAMAVIAFIAFIYIHSPFHVAATSVNNTTSIPTAQSSITPSAFSSPTAPSPTPTATPSPTPTLTPTTPTPKAGDILFTAKFDRSQAWVGDPSWSVYGNALHTSGSGTILVPYKVQPGASGVPNFTIKFQATQQGDGAFGVGIRVNDDSSGGYQIGTTGYDINQQHWLRIKGTHPWKEIPFDPGKTAHTYEVTIINDHITVKVDGALLLQADDGTYPTGQSITLYSENVTYYITSLVVIQA